MHSTYSDGWLSPRELVDMAFASGISLISITDHDSVGGIEEASIYGSEKGITIIPGVEISAEIDGAEIHILGYFIDYESDVLLAHLRNFRKHRIDRSRMIIGKLNELGSKITLGNVLSFVGSGTSVGRPHIARALSDEGFVNSYSEAFYKYIGDGKPAYIKKPNVSAEKAIELIANAGGLSFIAHPGKYISEDTFAMLIDFGLDGIEIVHPSHKNSDIEMLKKIAELNFLLTSGGSDFHGGSRNDLNNFGAYFVSVDEVNNMKRRLIL